MGRRLSTTPSTVFTSVRSVNSRREKFRGKRVRVRRRPSHQTGSGSHFFLETIGRSARLQVRGEHQFLSLLSRQLLTVSAGISTTPSYTRLATGFGPSQPAVAN